MIKEAAKKAISLVVGPLRGEEGKGRTTVNQGKRTFLRLRKSNKG